MFHVKHCIPCETKVIAEILNPVIASLSAVNIRVKRSASNPKDGYASILDTLTYPPYTSVLLNSSALNVISKWGRVSKREPSEFTYVIAHLCRPSAGRRTSDAIFRKLARAAEAYFWRGDFSRGSVNGFPRRSYRAPSRPGFPAWEVARSNRRQTAYFLGAHFPGGETARARLDGDSDRRPRIRGVGITLHRGGVGPDHQGQ